jgi:hypothetical protein
MTTNDLSGPMPGIPNTASQIGARSMSCRRLFAISIQATVFFGGWPAFAGGPISPASDILGVNLTMSRDQAKKVIADAFPGSSIDEVPVELTTDVFKKSATAGFFGSASGGDFGNENVLVLYNPNDNASDVFGVFRGKAFPNANLPVAQVLLDSLYEKYGQPTRSTGNTLQKNMIWAAPGVLERTDRSLARCDSNGLDYFYEGVDKRFIGEAFVGRMNLIANKNPMQDYSKCGTILQVSVMLSPDGTYARSMTERLIDLTKATAELNQFSNSFWSAANAAKQTKVSKDSQNKPKL